MALETRTENLDPVTGNRNSLIGVRPGSTGLFNRICHDPVGDRNPTPRVQHYDAIVSASLELSSMKRSWARPMMTYIHQLWEQGHSVIDSTVMGADRASVR
jgi:hypothetical protein